MNGPDAKPGPRYESFMAACATYAARIDEAAVKGLGG